MKNNILFVQKINDKNDLYSVVNFSGHFDSLGFKQNFQLLQDLVKNQKNPNLVFDFSNLEFINSQSIGFLIESKNYLEKDGKNLILVGADDAVKDVLLTTGVFTLISAYDSLEDFKNTLK